MVRILLSAVLFAFIFGTGLIILRTMARPVPPPLPPGEMRKVNLRYRCDICGAEVKMVQASEEVPDPPRHCQEDMVLVAPPIE